MEKKLQNNIWKYTLLLITNKRIFIAILGAYYLTIPGVTPQIIGLILLAGNISAFFFEIPSGYVSDKMGHKQALVVAGILMMLSSLFFLFATNIVFLILGSIFMSASFAFHSGTGSAFFYETLQGLERENDYTRIMGKISSISFSVPIVLTSLIPFFVSVSYKTPLVIVLILDFVGLLIAISLTAPPVPPKHIEEIGVTNFKQVLREGYRLNYFSIALFSGIVFGVMLSIGAFRSPYQVFLEIPVIWYGIFFGVGRGLAAIILGFSGRIQKKTNLLSFFRLQIIIFTFLILTLGIASNPSIIVLVFIIQNGLYWGFHKIDESYRLGVIQTSKFKATLLSVRSLIAHVVGGVLSFSVGFLIERLSYQHGFLYLGVVFFVALTPLYFYIAHKYKKGMYGNVDFATVVRQDLTI